MTRTLASERAAQADATPAAAPAAAELPVAEPVTAHPAAVPPAAKPTGRLREPIARHKPETTIKSKARKVRGKTVKKDTHIRGLYAVRIAENTKPKRPRRERMQLAHRYVVNGKEEDDHNWATLHDIVGHLEEEQFVGCLYVLAKHVGNAVNDLGTPVMQGTDLLNKRYKK
jgi:hypothetical protein